MKIETKFDVNNLVVSKYQRNVIASEKNDSLCCLEVIEVKTGTCMAGTQVFYVCRPIHGITEKEFIDGKMVKKFVDFNMAFTSSGEYCTCREDELVAAPDDVIDLVLGKS